MRTKSIAYWAATAILAFCIGSGGIADLIQYPATVAGVVLLGYPAYFTSILGFWKILGAIALVVPGFARVKEWAYAGIFFNVTGAVVSHVVMNDYGVTGYHVWVNVVFAMLVVVSWALRPESWVLGELFPRREARGGRALPALG